MQSELPPAPSDSAPSAPSKPPRHILYWVSACLWGLFTLVTFRALLSNAAIVMGSTNSYITDSSTAMLLVDIWSIAAAIVVGLAVTNPFDWLNGKRLIFGCLAFALMLGRLALGFYVGRGFYYLGIAAPVEFVLVPLALLVAGFFAIVGLFLIVMAVFGAVVVIPMTMFNQIFAFEHSLNVYRYSARGLSRYIVRFVLWLRNERMPAALPDDSKGARFATFPEIQRLYSPDAPEAMVFGHIDAPLALKTDKHVLIMASTRSGKGVTLIIPHLLRYRGSAFVLDPKGENAKATGRQRTSIGTVHYLDPFGISGKPQSRFNPLSRFTPQNMEAESKALAGALFIVQDGQRDHWTSAGQQLLATIILYVYASPTIPPERKDLPTVRRLLLGALKPTLEAMVKMDEADGLLRDLAMSFLETPEREMGSIVSTTQRQTEILDNPFMLACLSAVGPGPEVEFSEWHDGKMTVYLCLSAPKFPVFNRWLRLVLTSALDEMTDRLNPPALPVCFMLDELATLGHLATVENAVGLAAGYGVQLVTVFQDMAQMKDLYKSRWASFIGNSGVRALFNFDDFDTAEYWSKFVGGQLVETRSSQQDIYGYSKGDNVGETMRPLISADKLMMEFASKRMLILAQGAHPIVTERVAYWDDATLKGLWDDPRRQVPPQRKQPRKP